DPLSVQRGDPAYRFESSPASPRGESIVEPAPQRLPSTRLRSHHDLRPESAPTPPRGRAILRHAQRRQHDRAPADTATNRLRASQLHTRRSRSAASSAASSSSGERSTAHVLLRRLARLRLSRRRCGLRSRSGTLARRATGGGMKSCLFRGELTHHRVRPARHEFHYSAAYFWVDLDELEALERRLRFFGVNRRRLFSFYEADHLDGRGGIRGKIEGRLAARGIELRGGAIFLLTQCRLLGYVFNPVSFYYAYD